MTPVAVITGGQRGIGFGIANVLSGAGFTVAIAAEKPADDPEVTAALAALPTARYYRHDMCDVSAAGALIDAIEADLGPVSTLVSNAGVPALVRGDMLEMLPENYDFVMDVNLKGGFFLAQAAAKRMLQRHDDHYRSILFVTSASAEMVSIERAEYCISKAGASMMTKLFAARLAQDGIGVFELRPGIISTDMTAGVRDKYSDRINDGLVPAKRWGQADDIAAVVLPLVTGQLAFSTGAAIPVDGGLHIHRL